MAESSPTSANDSSNNNIGNGTASQPPVDPSQNPISPYYLHPGENLGVVLVSPPLFRDNDYHWSKAMQRVLSSKNKHKFINGSLPRPTEIDPLSDSWERFNNLVVSWIARTISPYIAQSTISFNNARDFWLDLQDHFTKGNHFCMSDILQEIHSMQQGDRSLSTFSTDMKIL